MQIYIYIQSVVAIQYRRYQREIKRLQGERNKVYRSYRRHFCSLVGSPSQVSTREMIPSREEKKKREKGARFEDVIGYRKR